MIARRALRVGLIAAVLPATSCASLRLYPVCSYNTPIPREHFEQFYRPRLLDIVNGTVDDPSRAKALLSPDGRWLVAKLTDGENKSLARVWPRVGCLGDATDSPTTKEEKDCAEYVAQFLTSRQYLTFGNAKDAGAFDIWNESSAPNTIVNCRRIDDQ